MMLITISRVLCKGKAHHFNIINTSAYDDIIDRLEYIAEKGILPLAMP